MLKLLLDNLETRMLLKAGDVVAKDDRPFLFVMPVHEGAEWIGATLKSLAAEPGEGLEIIVIDSSPTNTTADIVAQFASRLPLQLLRRTEIKPWQTKTNLGVEIRRPTGLVLPRTTCGSPVGRRPPGGGSPPRRTPHFMSSTSFIDHHGRTHGALDHLPAGGPDETQTQY